MPLDVNWAELGRDVSEFIRRLRLKEFFHDKPSGKEPNPFKNKSNWCPPKNRNFCIEQFIHKIEEEVRNFRSKRVKDNFTVDERRELKSLCKDNSIVIKPEDKGSSLMVQDKSNYISISISKTCEELINGNVYEKLNEDATDQNVSAVKEIVNNMLLVGDIKEETAEYLIPSEAKPSRFYTLPKTHKVKPGSDVLPVRPVISGCGSATERLSEFVDYHLKPSVPKLESLVKDSKHLIRKIEETNAKGPLPEGSSLFTIDVVAMYPSVPKDLGFQAAKEALNQREIKKP